MTAVQPSEFVMVLVELLHWTVAAITLSKSVVEIQSFTEVGVSDEVTARTVNKIKWRNDTLNIAALEFIFVHDAFCKECLMKVVEKYLVPVV